jgi:hypothetical protein
MTHPAHTHGTEPHVHAETPPTGPRWSAVLDIGGDVGALILYTPPELVGAEIEVSPIDRPDQRTHTQVLERQTSGPPIHAALYAELTEGTYWIWDDDPDRTHVVTIRGGRVEELDWRSPSVTYP